MEYLIYIAVAVISYFVGWHMRGVVIMMRLIKNPDGFLELVNNLKAINKDEIETTPTDAVEMEIEKVNGVVYAYDKQTGEFLAQAQNIYQVAVLAASRYPGKKFWHPELKEDTQTA